MLHVSENKIYVFLKLENYSQIRPHVFLKIAKKKKRECDARIYYLACGSVPERAVCVIAGVESELILKGFERPVA